MLEKPDSLCFHQLVDHVTQHSTDSVETLICVAYVGQASLVQEDLLDDKDGDGLGQLRTRFHNPEAKRNDFSGEQEMYNGIVIVLLLEE